MKLGFFTACLAGLPLELEGTEAKVKQGLAIGLAHLQECRAEASSPQPA